MPTFNILIATTGRACLQNMLNSLTPQMKPCDCITIVYDGHTRIPEFDLTQFKCKVQEFFEPKALGFWGHGIRNKYASLMEKKDFVMHADDDDKYFPTAFKELREQCTNKDTLYIAKMLHPKHGLLPPREIIKLNYIGTPCGIIPYDLNMQGKWLSRYGGDGFFYEHIASLGSPIVYLPSVIYLVR